MTRLRLATITTAALFSVALLSACDPGGGPAGDPTPGPSVATTTPVATPGATPGATPTTAAPAALACADVRNASVYARVAPYNMLGEGGLPFTDGLWTGPGGLTVAVQAPCAVGELVPGSGPTAVVALMSMTAGTTGRNWAVATCRPDRGHVYCSPMTLYEDREPVEAISISGSDITVVYLTRTPDVPPAGVNIRRTTVYRIAGDHFVEVRHSDAAL